MYTPDASSPVRKPKTWPIREIILCVVLFAAGIAVGYAWHGIQATGGGSVDLALDRSGADDPAQGSAKAKVVIIEFADYECGYCRMWYQQVYAPLMAQYGDRIRFVFRDFPLDFHPNSQPAAEAANCAGAQGKYWDYQDQVWGTTGGNLDSASLRQYAQNVGLDLAAFDQCTGSKQFADEIRLDVLDGMRKGVNGTPAFLVNDQLVPGVLPFDQFSAIVEQKLAE